MIEYQIPIELKLLNTRKWISSYKM